MPVRDQFYIRVTVTDKECKMERVYNDGVTPPDHFQTVDLVDPEDDPIFGDTTQVVLMNESGDELRVGCTNEGHTFIAVGP